MFQVKNNKFKYLVDELKNKNRNYLIDEFQKNSSQKLFYQESKFIKKELHLLFKKIIKSNKNSNLNEIPQLVKENKKLSNDNLIIKRKNRPIIENPIDSINLEKRQENTLSIPELKDDMNLNEKKKYTHSNLSKFSEKFNIIEYVKTNHDIYSIILCKYIDPIFRNYKDKNTINDYLKHFKIKIIDIFNKQDFYRNKFYSFKDFKKSDLDDIFINNKMISLSMIKVYCDVLNINLVYQHLDEAVTKFNFMNNFISKRATLVLFENKSKLFIVTSLNKYLIRGEDISNLLHINKKFSKQELEKYKLDDLQNISKMKNICIKKDGKISKINKLKEELIEEIIDSVN